jgi:hypothetical protein
MLVITETRQKQVVPGQNVSAITETDRNFVAAGQNVPEITEIGRKKLLAAYWFDRR